jgi:hypothetical protein
LTWHRCGRAASKVLPSSAGFCSNSITQHDVIMYQCLFELQSMLLSQLLVLPVCTASLIAACRTFATDVCGTTNPAVMPGNCWDLLLRGNKHTRRLCRITSTPGSWPTRCVGGGLVVGLHIGLQCRTAHHCWMSCNYSTCIHITNHVCNVICQACMVACI